MIKPNVAHALALAEQVAGAQMQQTPEGAAAFQKAGVDKWWPVIKAANFKVE